MKVKETVRSMDVVMWGYVEKEGEGQATKWGEHAELICILSQDV